MTAKQLTPLGKYFWQKYGTFPKNMIGLVKLKNCDLVQSRKGHNIKAVAIKT